MRSSPHVLGRPVSRDVEYPAGQQSLVLTEKERVAALASSERFLDSSPPLLKVKNTQTRGFVFQVNREQLGGCYFNKRGLYVIAVTYELLASPPEAYDSASSLNALKSLSSESATPSVDRAASSLSLSPSVSSIISPAVCSPLYRTGLHVFRLGRLREEGAAVLNNVSAVS